jgi:hypothetical protein
MRTKTLLLTAGALLAAGLISSQAQPVYSANIVGYATVPTSAGAPVAMAVPFDVGVSNGANEIWPSGTLPDGSLLFLWNGTAFNTFSSDSTSTTGWRDTTGTAVPAPTLPVGQGFFLVPAANVTNVFAGTIAVNVGTSNQMVLSAGIPSLVSPVVPYAGSITNGTSSGGGPNLSPAAGLPDGSLLFIWNGTGFDTYSSDSTSATGWRDTTGTAVPAPNISVGQAFFLVPAGNFTWTVGL